MIKNLGGTFFYCFLRFDFKLREAAKKVPPLAVRPLRSIPPPSRSYWSFLNSFFLLVFRASKKVPPLVTSGPPPLSSRTTSVGTFFAAYLKNYGYGLREKSRY